MTKEIVVTITDFVFTLFHFCLNNMYSLILLWQKNCNGAVVHVINGTMIWRDHLHIDYCTRINMLFFGVFVLFPSIDDIYLFVDIIQYLQSYEMCVSSLLHAIFLFFLFCVLFFSF